MIFWLPRASLTRVCTVHFRQSAGCQMHCALSALRCFVHCCALCTECNGPVQHSALSAASLLCIQCSVRALCVPWVEGGCARQEGHGPWVLRQNPHGAHLEAKDMVWNKGGRDSGDLGHATTLPRQTALMSLIEVQSPRVLSAFFKVVGKRNFSNSKMRFIEPIRNLLSDLFSDN